MLLILFLLTSIAPHQLSCSAEWILSNIILPRSDWGTAIAFYNSSVYLVGGESNRHQLVQYIIDEDVFIDHDSTNSSYDIWSGGQYYCQTANILYMVTADMLAIFNLEDTRFTNHYNMRMDTGDGACIASTNEYIYIVGGGFGYSDYLDTLQILDLASTQWINNTVTLQEKRGLHSCVVHLSTNTLYSIAGQNDLPSTISDDRHYVNGNLHTVLHSIEVISTINITNQSCRYNLHNLTELVTLTRCVVYDDSIFVLGGLGSSSSQMSVINVATGKVSSGPQLVYGVYSLSAIVIHDLLYAFGGFSSATGDVNKVQYYNLSAAEPTTTEPTTAEPTTREPTTDEPTTREPITAEPTTREPTTDEPITTEIKTVERTNATENVVYDNRAHMYAMQPVISFIILILCVDLILALF